MSILVGNDTRLIVQGITGGEGSFHTAQMVEYGTQVVAGVTPGKSGTLLYEAIIQLTNLGIGKSTGLGIGGDPIIGSSFTDLLKLFAEDNDTHAVVLIGEIGGTAEEEAAAWIQESGFDKPVVAFIAGRTAPPGRRMGHAGAIISGGKGTADSKMETLSKAGITVVESPAIIGETVKKVMA